MKTILCLQTVTLILAIVGRKKDGRTHGEGGPPAREKKWIVTTIAGHGEGFFEDGVAYVADALNHRIRKITGGFVTTFAGFNMADTSSGTGISAGYALPVQLIADNNNLYTLDIGDFRIRRISPNAEVTVVARSDAHGFADGNAYTARFEESLGIAADETGNLYVSDFENKRIRKVDTKGQVTTIAGNGIAGYIDGDGLSAEFIGPTGIVADGRGNLFADFNRIRKITPDGIVSTFAGGDEIGYKDGPGGIAAFNWVGDMVMASRGNLFVSDNNRIRKISTAAEVSTIAGAMPGYLDGEGIFAEFNLRGGLVIDKDDNL